ncbi:MAG: hypothetical protein NC221_03835, partial [Duncaniella sp.]|nr:hypothetical protein [Duncaniella sp.]
QTNQFFHINFFHIMKKLLTFVILAIAGIATASAYGIWVNYTCPDGFHYSEYMIVQDDLDEEQEKDLINEHYDEMMEKLCDED